jgi:hypothetical protein
MTVQHGTTLRNALADAYETNIGTAPVLEIRTGAPPANPAAADSGTLLCSITLPSDWLTAASAGVKSRNGTWSASASATGTAGHYRLKGSGGTPTHEQGTVTATGGGGDMTLDNTSIAAAQQVTVTSFTLTAGGA